MENFRNEIKTKLEEIRKESDNKLKTELKTMESKLQPTIVKTNIKMEGLAVKLSLMELKLFRPIDVFIWKVDRFSEKRKQKGCLMSEYFYSHRDGHKMWMWMFPDGTDIFRGTHLSIQFQIVPGENDADLRGPLNRSLNVGIVDQDTAQVRAVVTQSCLMKLLDLSPLFNFLHEDLAKFTAIKGDSLIVRCDL